MKSRGNRGFTLIELLVVISIIILATAMAVPAVNKFTRGQGLENAGRLMQSAFNEARRSAITTRKPHYLILFLTENPNPSLKQFGFRAFQQGKLRGDGYTDAQYLLPNSVAIQMTPVTTPGLVGLVQEPQSGLPPGFLPGSPLSGCRIAVFNTCPYPGATLRNGKGGESGVTGPDWLDNAQTYEQFFVFPSMRPNIQTSDNHGWLKFIRDGTVQFESGNPNNGAGDVPGFRISGDSLYDRNINYPETSLIEDQILADFTLRQTGEPKKRCFIDIDPNTGRARYRVAQLNGYSGAAGGVGTTSSTAGGSNGG
jgi:prepilin-type N-terminal cleavage/methylation domain-containing protein